MKVHIGKPKSFLTSKLSEKYLELKYGKNYFAVLQEPSPTEKFLEKADDIINDVIFSKINNIIPEPKEKVRIDRWDSWCFRSTLTPIILPMLVQLKATQHGAPYVADEDVPSWLHVEGEDNAFKRWDWVLDEMIYAFAAEDTLFMEVEERELVEARIQNGFELFGKYFQALWD